MKLKNTIITTGRRAQTKHIELAKALAEKWGIEYIFRGRESVEDIKFREKVTNVIVVKEEKLALETVEGEFFFHPNLAKMRIRNIKQGMEDYLLKALNIKEGDSVLDCTLGFGSDAIVESFAVGNKVVALEKNPLVAAVIGYGLKNNVYVDNELEAAMRRIEIVNADALEFLKKQADKSFDAVYFDPMFRHPLMESENLKPLRALAEYAPISKDAVTEAKRVARKSVVLKENARSLEFERLGFKEFVGGKYSKIRYGVIHL